MYIAKLRITNFRCFEDHLIEFCPGVNVLIGENNAGKTTVIAALGLVLDQRQRHRRRLSYFDFHLPVTDISKPPRTTVTVTFRSTPGDTIEDKALVADWLTKLDPPWEATLTYTFALESDDEAACIERLQAVAKGDEEYRNAIDTFLPKYVGRTYGGDSNNALSADREMLEKIDFQMLDALRDAERELFVGTNPLPKRILREIRDAGKTAQERAQKEQEFRQLSTQLGAHLRSRVILDPVLRDYEQLNDRTVWDQVRSLQRNLRRPSAPSIGFPVFLLTCNQDVVP